MIKDKPILKSIIWTFVILIFPVVSGVITQVLMMNNIQTMFYVNLINNSNSIYVQI